MSKATFGQAFQALNLIHAKDPSSERLGALYGSGILSDLLDPAACLDRDAIRIALKLGVVMPEQIVLSVDYGQTLEQMIAAGYYDWTNSDITQARFPIVGDGVQQFEAKIFHFDCNISSEKAVKEIETADIANPWEPGKIEHTLSFGTKFPEEQRKYPIIGLGSVAKISGLRSVPSLDGDGTERGLGLGWWDFDWFGFCRFLAVRKLSSAPVA